MVTLPKEFIAIRYEGYFLNIINMCLYSLKRTGTLKELKHARKSPWRRAPGYTVSNRGESYLVSDNYLETLKTRHLRSPRNTMMPVTHVYADG